MSTLSTTPRAEGHEAAVLVLARMALCPDTTEQAELLHEAMLDLIDVSLGWNNLEPTLSLSLKRKLTVPQVSLVVKPTYWISLPTKTVLTRCCT